MQPSKAFLKWLNSIDDENPTKVQVDSFQNGANDINVAKLNEVAEKSVELIQSGEIIDLKSSTGGYAYEKNNFLNFHHKINNNTQISRLRFHMQKHQCNVISNLNIRRLVQKGWDINIPDYLTIKNCWIDKLSFNRQQTSYIWIENCEIGQIEFDHKCIKNLHIENSAILAVHCHTPDEDNPFSGQVTIKSNVYFPRKENEYRGKVFGYQNYSNLTAHLMNLHNIEAASKVHCVEARLQRPHLAGTEWLFSWVYYLFSNYGNSIKRPLSIIIGFSLLSFLLFLPEDNLILIEKNKAGWLNSLKNCYPFTFLELTFDINVCEAAWFSFKPVLNPLGVIFGDNYLRPANLILMFFHSIERLVVITCVFFLFLALRRKFRLSS